MNKQIRLERERAKKISIYEQNLARNYIHIYQARIMHPISINMMEDGNLRQLASLLTNITGASLRFEKKISENFP